MKTLGLDFNFDNVEADHTSYNSSVSLLNYDIVFWDPQNIPHLYKLHQGIENSDYLPIIPARESVSAREDKYRRNKEIKDFLKIGKTLFILLPHPLRFSFTNKDYPFYTATSVRDFIPLKDLYLYPSSGNNIKFHGKGVIKSFLDSTRDMYEYSCYMEGHNDGAFAYIGDSSHCIGSMGSYESGHIVFLPTLREIDSYQKSALLSAIRNLTKRINKTDDYVLPDWAAHFSLPNEKEQNLQFQQLQDKKQQIEDQIKDCKDLIQQIENFKILFAGDGTPLEEKVREIFEELGFRIKPGEPGRDDLILESTGHIAVVEIKGLTKSAAEKNAAQLEKWISNYYLDNDIQPKGILLINAHKDTALSERTAAPFPHQMLAYSEQRKHCLITGLQLLGLYLDVKANPEKKEALVESLFDTVGTYEGYKDWREFLGQVES